MGRGQLTDRVKEASRHVLGYEISREELRLMAYVQFVMMNEQRLDPAKVSGEERLILAKWRKAEYIEGGASGMSVSKKFWDAMCEILWHGYVDYED